MEARGVRIGWSDLPQHVVAAVQDVLGAPVVTAESQSGGFSPGTADRVVTADGTRAFVKAVSPAQNPDSALLHRQEIVVTRSLPRNAPVAQLLGSYDDGDWVALVLEDIDGTHPRTPWDAAELDRVLQATAQLADALTPSPLPNLPHTSGFRGWDAVRADPPDGLDAWARDHLNELAELESLGVARLVGDTLMHCDLRADNILLVEGGGVRFIDWPWAANGPRWLDTLFVLVNVEFYGGHDTDALLARYCSDADPDVLTGVLAGFAGFLVDHARRPPPPGLPTVRDFQAAQALAVLQWLRRRR